MICLVLSAGCGSDPAKPGVDPEPLDPSLFFEPQSFCSRDQAGTDSLGIYNMGDSTITVDIAAPAWLQGLPASVTIPPDFYANLTFVWTQQSPPRADSLILETGQERAAIPIHLLGLGDPEPAPPDPPELALPEDLAVYTVGDTIPVWWARTDNCAPGVSYRLQVAVDSSFATRDIVLDQRLTTNVAFLVTEPGDEGVAYWRVRSSNGVGSTNSAFRSWTILPFSTLGPR